MLSLRVPEDVDTKRYFDEIVDGRQKAIKERLQGVTGTVHTAYDSYWVGDDKLVKRAPISSFEEPVRDALKRCWDARKNPGQRLERDVGAWQDGRPAQDTCPYCGIGQSKDTFEHYLPQAKFPEFAVFALNIVPCCSQCNRTRDWRDENGERKLLHFYFDEIEEQAQYLSARVYEHVVPNGKHRWRAKFTLAEPDEPTEFLRRYRRHFKTLGLEARFNDKSDLYLSHKLPRVVRAYEVGSKQRARRVLQKQAGERAKHHGFNEWENATLRAAADSDAYLTYCLKGPG